MSASALMFIILFYICTIFFTVLITCESVKYTVTRMPQRLHGKSTGGCTNLEGS